MAATSFIDEKDLTTADKALSESDNFSTWLGQYLEGKLKKIPGWQEALPIALGSWARGELAPHSDIDLLFVGEEAAVLKFVEQAQAQGLKIRYRMPEDPKDWTVNVKSFDVLALLDARAFDERSHKMLLEQQALIASKGKSFVQSLLKDMTVERKSRNERFDSISNYLEPNIKYGPGGLRDLTQAQYVFKLFEKRFKDSPWVFETLKQDKAFLLRLRQKLNLQASSDVLLSTEQIELAKWFGFENVQDFMREVQQRLSRVSFVADWVVAAAKAGAGKIKVVQERAIKNLSQALLALQEDPSTLMQMKVKSALPEVMADTKQRDRRQIGRWVFSSLHWQQSEDFFYALFRSGLMAVIFPEFKRLEGLVQHDQYHRYTADAHILQAIRQVLRLLKRPQKLKKLSSLFRHLTDDDRRVLFWTAIYHDMAKGRGGDHSTQGAELLKEDFTAMGFSLRLTVEVAWMVENHLLLSTAAFRRNLHSPSTWRELHQRGVKGQRLRRLAIFTVVDILATNPEAWNDWKESLLLQLVNVMESPRVDRYARFMDLAEKQNLKLNREFLGGLDPALVEELPPKVLLKDYERLENEKGDLEVLIIQQKDSVFWLRFHRRVDRPGLFREFTQTLFAIGCKIQQASIHTFDEYGVYDWFKVLNKRTKDQLKKMLSFVTVSDVKPPQVVFDNIKVVSEDESEVIISFRGKDQKGALIAAAEALFAENLTIRWARVHTWGRQIDDVFGVSRVPDFEEVIKRIREKLVKAR